MSGGEPGHKGVNLMKYADGRVVNLGSKTSVQVDAGVSINYIFLSWMIQY